MTPMYCPECGHAVPGPTSTCPSCGYRMDTEQRQQQTRWALFAAGVVLGSVLGACYKAIPAGMVAGAVLGGILGLIHQLVHPAGPSKKPGYLATGRMKPPNRC